MARSRSNGKTGENILLYAFFYKNGELAEPSSVGTVELLDSNSNVMASIASSDLDNLGNGIYRANYYVPESWAKGHYIDRWNGIVYEIGDSSTVKGLDFIVRESTWEVTDDFSPPHFNIVVESDYHDVKLYEKRWLKFNITDTNNVLDNTDEVDILFKDYNGSNVYLSSATVNDRMNAYYYFNSSQLKADYPDYIDRDNVYEWIFKVKYREQEYQPDAVQFKFSET